MRLFTCFDAVLVTHGHFDHIYSIPELVKKDKNVPVYCTETPKRTLIREGVPEKTKAFIDRYRPRKILADHFDDAFPPVTRNVSVERLRRMIEKNHPEIEFIIPEICKAIEL